MPCKAVIFDMDGVLIDSEPLHLEAANVVLGREGAHLSAADNEEYLGSNEQVYWTALVERFSLKLSAEHYIRERHGVLVDILKDRLPVAPGVAAFLAELRRRGLPVALASSSERDLIDHVVQEGGLSSYFVAIASGDEVRQSKPDPEIFLLAASRMGVSPEDCLVFEDSKNGVTAAHRAGMCCVRVVTETTRALSMPHVAAVIESFVGLDVDDVLNLERKRA